MRTKQFSHIVALLTISCCSSTLFAEEHTHHHSHSMKSETVDIVEAPQMMKSGVMATHAHAIRSIPGVKVSSGYVNLVNHTNEPIKIIGVESNITAHTEIHRMFERDSKIAMRKVESFEIAPHQTFALTPGGFHVMFMTLKESMKEGQMVDVAFLTESGEKLHVKMPVVAKE